MAALPSPMRSQAPSNWIPRIEPQETTKNNKNTTTCTVIAVDQVLQSFLQLKINFRALSTTPRTARHTKVRQKHSN